MMRWRFGEEMVANGGGKVEKNPKLWRLEEEEKREKGCEEENKNKYDILGNVYVHDKPTHGNGTEMVIRAT